MNRREILKTLLHISLLFSPLVRRGTAMAKESNLWQFHWVKLNISPRGWRDKGIKNFLWELEKRTSVVAAKDIIYEDPSSRDLLYRPFATILGYEPFSPLDEKAVANLRKYLDMGGFLFIEDASGVEGSPFLGAVEQMLMQIFPGKSLEPLGKDHVIYRTFFLLNRIYGRFDISRYFLGIQGEHRSPVVVSLNDALGAIERSSAGSLADAGGSDVSREMSLRTLINVVMYALTVNYKQDQIHIPYITRRLRKR